MEDKNFFVKYKNALLLLVLIVISIAVYLLYFKKEVRTDKNGRVLTEDDYEYYNSHVKDDTLAKFGFIAKENYVIREDADVRRTPNRAMYNTVYKLKFGTKVYTKNLDEESEVNDIDETLLERETRGKFIAIYANEPILLSEKPVGYIHVDDILEASKFQEYKPKKKKINPIKLESAVQATIESNMYIEDIEYQFSKDIKRFNKSIVYGDFNADGNRDFAVIIDNVDKSSSVLQIYFNNPTENVYNLAYKKVYQSLLKIKLVPKETDVMVNSETTQFPLDGISISNTGSSSYFHIYNTDNNTFMVLPN